VRRYHPSISKHGKICAALSSQEDGNLLEDFLTAGQFTILANVYQKLSLFMTEIGYC
jgi:hypothetical protein